MAAGIVTVDDTVFVDLVSGYPPAVRPLALGARSLIYAVLPATVEVVWPRQGTVGYGTGPKKLSEQFCWLAAAPAHLVFGFYYGTELPDPAHLLEGTGRRMRHTKVRTPADLAAPALRDLVAAAVRHRVPPARG